MDDARYSKGLEEFRSKHPKTKKVQENEPQMSMDKFVEK